MPKSRGRAKAVYTPPSRSAKSKVSPPWLVPTMVSCFLVGLAWIAVYYITQNGVPGMSALGNWNLVVGFTFVIAGLILATRWR